MFLNLTLLFSISYDVFVMELRKSWTGSPLCLDYGVND